MSNLREALCAIVEAQEDELLCEYTQNLLLKAAGLIEDERRRQREAKAALERYLKNARARSGGAAQGERIAYTSALRYFKE